MLLRFSLKGATFYRDTTALIQSKEFISQGLQQPGSFKSCEVDVFILLVTLTSVMFFCWLFNYFLQARDVWTFIRLIFCLHELQQLYFCHQDVFIQFILISLIIHVCSLTAAIRLILYFLPGLFDQFLFLTEHNKIQEHNPLVSLPFPCFQTWMKVYRNPYIGWIKNQGFSMVFL